MPREHAAQSVTDAPERRHPDTFGLEPSFFERAVPKVIRSLAPALRRFEQEGLSAREAQDEFRGVYPEAKIAEDWTKVERLERVFDAEDDHQTRLKRLYTMVFELIMQDVANLWFSDCVVWRASKFDDYARQTDLLMDVPGPDGIPLSLAIDVTTSRSAASDKVSKALEEYRRGTFHDVEYFASDTDPERPRGRTYLPRVIVGAQFQGIARLARQYGDWRSTRGALKVAATEALRFHPLAGDMFEELIAQLDRAHSIMQQNLNDLPNNLSQTTRREALTARAAYLRDARAALSERYTVWKKLRAEYEKGGNTGRETDVPANGVRDVLLMA